MKTDQTINIHSTREPRSSYMSTLPSFIKVAPPLYPDGFSLHPDETIS